MSIDARLHPPDPYNNNLPHVLSHPSLLGQILTQYHLHFNLHLNLGQTLAQLHLHPILHLRFHLLSQTLIHPISYHNSTSDHMQSDFGMAYWITHEQLVHIMHHFGTVIS